MRNPWKAGLVVAAVAAIGFVSYWSLAQRSDPSLARLMPQGAVLFVEAGDLSGLLAEWNGSPQRAAWLKSDSYRVFSNSRMLLRLQQLQGEFERAAGVPPNMSFLSEVAGGHSALGIYDIGKFEILYITHLPSSRSMQSTLWQKRSHFEPRQVNGREFFVRTDPDSQRVAAFAVSGDYLILATREDLVAGALSLMAGKDLQALAAEEWHGKLVKAAKEPGDLRMAINLAKVSHTPQFRTYWIQQNVTDTQQYECSMSDLYRSGAEYREERVLFRAENARPATAVDAEALEAVSELARLAPPESGFYQATAKPGLEDVVTALESKILTPRLGPAPMEKRAPSVSLGSGIAGSASDLETRIDVAPVARPVGDRSDVSLRQLLIAADPKAILHVQRSEVASNGVFVKLLTTIVLASAQDWDEAAARSAIQQVVSPGLTTSALGTSWNGSGKYWELDGLERLVLAGKRKYLVVSNDPEMVGRVLDRMREPVTQQNADYVAGFNHARERENFYRLTAVVDRPSQAGYSGQTRTPEFFSQNMSSFSRAFSGVQNESIVIRRSGMQEFQTVRYQWAQ